MPQRVEASTGWGVLHLFYRVDPRRSDEPGTAKQVLDALDAFTAEEPHQAITFVVLGHKAEVGVMAVGPDLARLQRPPSTTCRAPRCRDVVVRLPDRGLRVRRDRGRRARPARRGGGRHRPRRREGRLAAWRERIAHYREQRVHPRLPTKR